MKNSKVELKKATVDEVYDIVDTWMEEHHIDEDLKLDLEAEILKFKLTL